MPDTPTPPPEHFAPFMAEESTQPEAPSQMPQTVTWTASEFITHDKSAAWYAGLGVTALIIAVVLFQLTKDAVTAAVVIVGALLLGVYGARKPRQVEYHLDSQGVHVGQKYYPFSTFRSFSVVPEGAFASVVFMPLQRFAPALTIYYSPDDEAKILDILSSQLPIEPHRPDPVDSLMKRIRF